MLDRVEVEGWKQPTRTSTPTPIVPRRVDACALVSPFDSMMWERDRVERLFGFRTASRSTCRSRSACYGYYVMPFLLGDRYVARVDLKADRADSRLLVQSAFAEPGIDDLEVAEHLHDELRLMATWLGLDDVVVADRGDLAPALAAVGRREE